MNLFPTEQRLLNISLHQQSLELYKLELEPELNFSRKIIPGVRFRALASKMVDETILCLFLITKATNISTDLFHPSVLPQDKQMHLLIFIIEPIISKTLFYGFICAVREQNKPDPDKRSCPSYNRLCKVLLNFIRSTANENIHTKSVSYYAEIRIQSLAPAQILT